MFFKLVNNETNKNHYIEHSIFMPIKNLLLKIKHNLTSVNNNLFLAKRSGGVASNIILTHNHNLF